MKVQRVRRKAQHARQLARGHVLAEHRSLAREENAEVCFSHEHEHAGKGSSTSHSHRRMRKHPCCSAHHHIFTGKRESRSGRSHCAGPCFMTNRVVAVLLPNHHNHSHFSWADCIRMVHKRHPIVARTIIETFKANDPAQTPKVSFPAPATLRTSEG